MCKKLLFSFVLVPLAFCSRATIHYVNHTATGLNNGNSWANAYTDFQNAINNSNAGDTLWIAQGTYLPTRRADSINVVSANNRNNAFVLKSGIKIFGGFAGNETQFSQRNWLGNLTILSGDFNNDDTGFVNNTENAYHVVITSNLNALTVLNGFTIKGGLAGTSNTTIQVNGLAIDLRKGAGWHNNSDSVRFENNRIVENYTGNAGGGWYNGGGSPRVNNLNISGNRAQNGGGVYNDAGKPIVSNTLISNNLVSTAGAGWFNAAGNLDFYNVTIAGNKAPLPTTATAGGFHNSSTSSGTATFRNCIVWGNSAPQLFKSTSGGNILCLNTYVGGGIFGGINANPRFVNATDYNMAPNINGDYSLKSCSPAINTGDTTDASFFVGDIDIASNPRIYNNTIDLGAYEYQSAPYLALNDTLLETACFGDSVQFNNAWYNSTGIYSDTLESSLGCDSIITMNLIIHPFPIAMATPSASMLCNGNSTNISLSSSVNNTTYTWTVVQDGVAGATAGSGNSIAQILTNIGNTIGTAIYTILPTANGCTGSSIKDTIGVNPVPDMTAAQSDSSLCSGDNINIALSSTVNGAAFSWTIMQTGTAGAAAGSGNNIAQTLINSGIAPGMAAYTIIPTIGICPGTATTVTVTVNPIPIVTANPVTQAICTGTTTNISLGSNTTGTSYTWAIAQSGVTGAIAGNGNSIAQTLMNPGTTIGTATYTVTPIANSCIGMPVPVTIIVNPKPNVIATPTNQILCSGSATNIALSSAVNGTTFNWTATQTGVTGASADNGNIIAQTLSATTVAPGAVSYTVTPTANNCPGTDTDITVTVNAIAAAPGNIIGADAPCSGSSQTYSVANIPNALSYIWTLPSGWTGNSTTNSIAVTVGNANGTITVAAANTCGNSSTSSKSITSLPTVTPTITINSNAPSPLCSGTSVIYTATTTGSGTLPSYLWKLNGYAVGSNSNTYVYTPNDGDTITCELISNYPCLNNNSATSNTLVTAVTPGITPTLNIYVAENHICSDSTVVFLATPTNGGTSPLYQWKVNNQNAGTNSVNFTYMPHNNDVVTCAMTSNVVCAVSPTTLSNPIPMTIVETAQPTLNITASPDNNLVNGQQVMFTANVGGTANQGYQVTWYKNNIYVPGATGNTWTAIAGTDVRNGTSVKASLHSFSPCAIPDTAQSNTIKISVDITGVNDMDVPKGFKAYPNPTQNIVKFEGLHAGDGFVLYDALGHRLQEHKIKGSVYSLDLSTYVQGIYVVSFIGDKGQKWQIKVTKL